ncbi:MAG: class I SAM-dependent methyltransferase [Acidimicrobiales bacterium]
MSGLPWEASYADGSAPWDIGRPQPAVVRLVSTGVLRGPVLDAGCGTGENALHVASSGLWVLGVDVAKTAIGIARDKATERGLDARFALADALDLGALGRTFATVLDCGLFHSLNPEERRRYAASLAVATDQGGSAYVLCFSDRGPDTGPHPVSEAELHLVFDGRAGWEIQSVQPERLYASFAQVGGLAAWMVTVKRGSGVLEPKPT